MFRSVWARQSRRAAGSPRLAAGGAAIMVGVMVEGIGAECRAGDEWTVVNLHPPTAAVSVATGVGGGVQAGYTVIGGTFAAGVWAGSAESWQSLHPAGATQSFAFGVGVIDDGAGGTVWIQVGEAMMGGIGRASMWSGSASSWVDLHPQVPFATASRAYGAGGGRQVGLVVIGGINRASIWSGSAGSWLDMTPAWALGGGMIYSADGERQAGSVIVESGEQHAAVWSGTAASCVDLNPTGPGGTATSSIAYGAGGGGEGGIQAGYAIFGGVRRAGMWSGTATSWVDLHPAGSTLSEVYGVGGGLQVGRANFGATRRAAAWSGSAASWVDLGAVLPAGFGDSYAQHAWSNKSTTFVAGWGANTVTGRTEALLWRRTDCEEIIIGSHPESVTVCRAGSGTFTVEASGGADDGPLNYQWQLRGLHAPGEWGNISDGPVLHGGEVIGMAEGTGTPTMTFTRFLPDAVPVRAVMWNSCAEVLSDEAELIVLGAECPADHNCSGGTPTVQDVYDYLTDWSLQAGQPWGSADFNGLGGVTVQDIYDFFTAWNAGCP